jgi:F-type H+-transporting ATPase subunit epsilon
MSGLFRVHIITPEGIMFNQDALSLIVPSQLGYLGILANHAPLAANLVKGRISVSDDSNRSAAFDIEGSGFIEVLKNKVTLLLDSSIRIPLSPPYKS